MAFPWSHVSASFTDGPSTPKGWGLLQTKQKQVGLKVKMPTT